MTANVSSSGLPSDHDPLRRNAARLAAVQALYQIEATQNAPEQVIKDFLIGRTGGFSVVENENAAESVVHLPELDSELFINIVRAVQNRGDDIDNMIKGSLSAEWPYERLEMILRAILRAGIAELLERTDIPAGATITEFIDVGHAFYEGPEPRMVNAVLDKVARALGRLDAKK
jgi:N utilization substance protein B